MCKIERYGATYLYTFHSNYTLKHCSKMASHTFFCSEAYCGVLVAASGSICSLCDRKHVCNGEMDYELAIKICDDRGDPLCPQHKAPVESCETCGCSAEFRDGERVCWCDSCQKDGCQYEHHFSGGPEERLSPSNKPSNYSTGNHVCSGERLCDGWPRLLICDEPTCSIRRPRCCADCGYTPEDGYFSTFRGSHPLCEPCAEAAYGPPSPSNCREHTGHCARGSHNYDLICSSDRRDLCYECK